MCVELFRAAGREPKNKQNRGRSVVQSQSGAKSILRHTDGDGASASKVEEAAMDEVEVNPEFAPPPATFDVLLIPNEGTPEKEDVEEEYEMPPLGVGTEDEG